MWINPFVLSSRTSRVSSPAYSLYSSSLFPTFASRHLLRSVDSLTSSVFHRDYELTQDDQGVYLRLNVPGLHLDQVQIEVKDRNLEIQLQAPELKVEEEAHCLLNEIQSSSTHYQFTLPSHVDLDQIQAEMKQGQLFLTLPKTQPVVKTIQVQEGLPSVETPHSSLSDTDTDSNSSLLSLDGAPSTSTDLDEDVKSTPSSQE